MVDRLRFWVEVLCAAAATNFLLYCVSAVLMMESMWGVLSSIQSAIAGSKASPATGSMLELQLAGQLTRRQLLGVFASVLMSFIVLPSVVVEFCIIGLKDWNLEHIQGAMLRNSILQSFDTLANILAAVVLSGGLSAEVASSSALRKLRGAINAQRSQPSVWFSCWAIVDTCSFLAEYC